MSAVAAGSSELQAEQGSPPFRVVVDMGKACEFAAAMPCRSAVSAAVGHAPIQESHSLGGQHTPAQSPAIGLTGQHLCTQPFVALGQPSRLGVGVRLDAGVRAFSGSGRAPGPA